MKLAFIPTVSWTLKRGSMWCFAFHGEGASAGRFDPVWPFGNTVFPMNNFKTIPKQGQYVCDSNCETLEDIEQYSIIKHMWHSGIHRHQEGMWHSGICRHLVPSQLNPSWVWEWRHPDLVDEQAAYKRAWCAAGAEAAPHLWRPGCSQQQGE